MSPSLRTRLLSLVQLDDYSNAGSLALELCGLENVLWLGLFFLKTEPISGVPDGISHRRPSLHILPCKPILQLSGQVVKILHHSSTLLQPSLSHCPYVSGHGTSPEHMCGPQKKFSDKNPSRTRFTPLYIFDTKNEAKNTINFVSCD